MAEHKAKKFVSKAILEAAPEIRKDVAGKLLDQLMNAVKVEALFGEVILSLRPIEEEDNRDQGSICFAQSVRLEPLVRCKDCKYRAEDDFCTGRGWPHQLVADDGFCEKGKRKGKKK